MKTKIEKLLLLIAMTFVISCTPEAPENKPNEFWYKEMGLVESYGRASMYLGKYEVTRRFFEEVMGFDPSNEYEMTKEDGKDRPVDNITVELAIEFCNKLSEMEGLPKGFDENGIPLKNGGYTIPEYIYINQRVPMVREYYLGDTTDVTLYFDDNTTETITTESHKVGNEASKYCWVNFNNRTGNLEDISTIKQPRHTFDNKTNKVFLADNGFYYMSNYEGDPYIVANENGDIWGTHKVGQKKDIKGFYDTIGNASELSWDSLFNKYCYYGGDVVDNYTWKTGNSTGVIKGLRICKYIPEN